MPAAAAVWRPFHANTTQQHQQQHQNQIQQHHQLHQIHQRQSDLCNVTVCYHAIVVCPFTAPDAVPANTPLVSLELGDTVYLIEAYYPPHPQQPDKLCNNPSWYRGYVFPSITSNTGSTKSRSANNTNPTLGIFPASHVYCRELQAGSVKSHARKHTHLPLYQRHMYHQQQQHPIVNVNIETNTNVDSVESNSTESSAKRRRPIPAPLQPTYETLSGLTDPLTDEISAALRSWSPFLQISLSTQNYALYQTLSTALKTLHKGRRTLLTASLTSEEALLLRRSLVFTLSQTSQLLKTDLIPRSDKGVVVAEGRGVVKSFRSHLELASVFESGYFDTSFVSGGQGLSLSSAFSSAGASSQALQKRTLKRVSASGHAVPPVVMGGPITGLVKHQSTTTTSNPTSSSSKVLSFMSGETVTTISKERSGMLDITDMTSFGSLSNGRSFGLKLELAGVGACICGPGEVAELSFWVWCGREKRALSEEFMVVIDYNGFPWRGDGGSGYSGLGSSGASASAGAGVGASSGAVDGTMGTRLSTVFEGIGGRDFGEHAILVCRIVRVGRMNVGDKEGPGGANAGFTSSSFMSLKSLTGAGGGSSSESLNSSGSGSVGMNSSKESGYMSEIGYRRPCGYAVLELEDVWKAAMESSNANNDQSLLHSNMGAKVDSSKTVGLKEYIMKMFFPSQESNFPLLYEAIINRTVSMYESSSRGDYLNVALQFIPQPNTNALANSGLASPISPPLATTERLGYPDIILPGYNRNSMYITLVSGEFSARTTTLSQKNIQVTAQLRTSNGDFIENCIFRGLGTTESHYSSLVYYHSNSPKWSETFRIDLEPQTLEKAHIFFIFRHCSSSNAFSASPIGIPDKNDKSCFAFAFLPLLRGDHTVLHDAAHTLTLYRYDRKLLSPSIYLTYQAGPSLVSTIHHTVTSLEVAADSMAKLPPLKDTMTIRTSLRSTLQTQSATILNLLHWRSSISHLGLTIESILKDIYLVPELEIVKFLHGILDALFDILHPDNGVNTDFRYDDQIFACLMFVLSVVIDRRFLAFGPTVDMYADKWFKNASCWSHLLRSIDKLLMDPVKRDLRDAIKVWGYWIRFVVRSGLTEEEKMGARSPDKTGLFMTKLAGFLLSIERLMSMTLPEAIVSQTLALQHFPQLLPDLARVYNPSELVNVVVKFADSVRGSRSKLNSHKLAFIHTLIRGPLFADRRSRLALVRAISRWMCECLSGEWDREKDIFTLQTNRLSTAPTTQSNQTENDTWRLCLNVTAELVDRLQKVGDRLDRGKQDEVRGIREQVGDTTNREEDFRKCLELVSNILPILLETYSNMIYSSDTLSLATLMESVNDDKSYNRLSAPDLISGDASKENNRHTLMSPVLSAMSISSPPTSPIVSVENVATQASSPVAPSIQSQQSQQLQQSQQPQQPQLYKPKSIELTELSIVIISILHLLPRHQLKEILLQSMESSKKRSSRRLSNSSLFSNSTNRQYLIPSLYVILQSLLRGDTFRPTWICAHFYVNRITVKILRIIGDVLKSTDRPVSTSLNNSITSKEDPIALMQHVFDDDQRKRMNQMLWADYFRILLQLLNSRWVAVESFTSLRARAALRLGADVRGDAGELLRSVWVYLIDKEKADHGFQMAFIPNLFGPFLELTMSPHPKLKAAAIELLFSVIDKEFRIKGDLSRIEVECVDRLDQLINLDGHGDEAYRRYFIETLGKHFTAATRDSVASAGSGETSHTSVRQSLTANSLGESHVAVATTFAAFGAKFLAFLDSYLELSIALKDLPSGESYHDERVWLTLKLMRFLRDAGRTGLYIKYIYSLYRLHVNAGHDVQAGMTIKLHADLLPWSHKINVAAAPEYGFPKSQTCFERKEKLYLLAISHFECANHWERALDLCKELASQYESVWHDYMKYSKLLVKESQLAQSIIQTERYHSNYYRVGFYGRGFPTTLRGKQFIYKAGEWEKLGPFCERILNKYVGAQLIRTNAIPGEEILNSQGSWIQIIAVTPEINITKWGSQDMKGAWLCWESSPHASLAPSNQNRSGSYLSNTSDIILSLASSSSPSTQNLPSQTTSKLIPPKSSTQTLPSTASDFETIPVKVLVEPDLDPNPDNLFLKSLSLLKTLPDTIKAYYTSNEVQLFSYSRPFRRPTQPPLPKHDPAKEFLELWIEKTLVLTADTFPCLSSRSPIVHSWVVELSPIENAVIAIRSKNRQLEEFGIKFGRVLEHARGADSAAAGDQELGNGNNKQRHGSAKKEGGMGSHVNLFTMALNGAVDAPVNGGIPMYRKAFLSTEYKEASGVENKGLVDMLEKSIEEQAKIIHTCLAIHDVVVPTQMRPLHDTLVGFYQKNFASEISRLDLPLTPKLPRPPSPHRNQNEPIRSSSEPTSPESFLNMYTIYGTSSTSSLFSANQSSLAGVASLPTDTDKGLQGTQSQLHLERSDPIIGGVLESSI